MGEIKKTILVVDDDTMARKTTIALLKKIGDFSIIEAGNGEDALVQIISNENHKEGKNNIDLMILDLNMPKMNGMSVLEKISSLGIQVLVVSGTSLEEQAYACEQPGVYDSITKPITLDRLQSKVSVILSRKEDTVQRTM